MKITEWLKESKTGLIILALAIGGLFTISACSGNTVTDFVQYKNPQGVQEALGVPEKQTLTDAPLTIAQWQVHVTENTKQLMGNVERAEQIAGLFSGIITGGLDLILQNDAVKNSVYGGLISLGVGAIAGIFLPQPGSGKRLAKEKEESFNAGQRKAQALLTATKDVING